MSIVAALRDAIRTDGRSLNALAELSGVDSGQISRFMRDERSLTLDSADKLIAALGMEGKLSRLRVRRPK